MLRQSVNILGTVSRSRAAVSRMASRAMATNPPSPMSPEFRKMVDQLEAKGTTYTSHVMGATSANVDKCPYLKTNPVAMRTAQRESNARSYNRRVPPAMVKGLGSKLWDAEGNEYLDGLANAGTLALGHNHPVVNDAIAKFMASGHPQQLLDMTSPVKDEFVTELFDTLPTEFAKTAKVQMCAPSGTDVIEAAIKLAQYATGRSQIISFSGAYHGHTMGALGLMGNLGAKESMSTPGWVQFAPYPYPYRCPFGMGNDAAADAMSYYLENLLDDVEGGVRKPAAVILEPVQGEGGVIPAPDRWLQEIRRITEERGILLICDEIQSGFGRTGHMFAHEASGVKPDIIALSKALGGGMPAGCIVYDKKWDTWGPGSHAGTFRGFGLGQAAGTASMKYMKEVNLPAEAKRKGDYIGDRLRELQQKYPMIGDIRQKGMMIGVEIVDATGKADHLGSLPASGHLAQALQARSLQHGLIHERGGRHGATCRFLPALTMTDSEVEDLCGRFAKSLEWVAANGK